MYAFTQLTANFKCDKKFETVNGKS